MSRHVDDARSKKIVFVSNCLLNTNNKVKELARYGGFCKDVMDVLASYDVGVQQMDCPETLYLGIQRWYHTKNLYDNVGFRRFCREMAERTVDYMECYRQVSSRWRSSCATAPRPAGMMSPAMMRTGAETRMWRSSTMMRSYREWAC